MPGESESRRPMYESGHSWATNPAGGDTLCQGDEDRELVRSVLFPGA